MSNKRIGRDVVGHVQEDHRYPVWELGMTNNRHRKVSDGPVQHRPFKEHRRCFQCGKLGHIVAKCPSKDPHENIDSDFTLAIPEMQEAFENIWTLDSGSSRHLVGNEDWMDDC